MTMNRNDSNKNPQVESEDIEIETDPAPFARSSKMHHTKDEIAELIRLLNERWEKRTNPRVY
jgi:hypothetical protein